MTDRTIGKLSLDLKKLKTALNSFKRASARRARPYQRRF